MRFNLIFSLLVTFTIFTLVSSGLIRDRRAVEDYWYSNQVLNNMVSDNIVGGPTSLGWAQVPHHYSPMYSPVFGK
uniref:Nematode Specific Peptide family, group E n=1 Tax=Caenorhabditis japonica TaxID=281687 RepID=A0A8R1HRQ9_CAEJA